MAQLQIERKDELSNRRRDYKVYVDGIKVGAISPGETKSLEIDPGKHEVFCKIDWCTSPTITTEVTNDSIKTLQVGGFKGGNLLWRIMIVILVVHFILKLAFQIEYVALFAIPVCLIGVYYVTFGRKKYLTLIEL